MTDSLDPKTNNPIIHIFDPHSFHESQNVIFNGAFFTPLSMEHQRSPSIYCAYRTTPSLQNWYESSIWMTKMQHGFDHQTFVPERESLKLLVAHGEDPRVLPLTDRHLLVTYTDVNRTNTRATIKGTLFLVDYDANECKPMKQLTFDLNASSQNKQKNWNFFVDPFTQHVFLIYRIMPFEIYDLGHINHVLFAPPDLYEKERHSMECMLRTSFHNRQFWKHPDSDILLLRGGTNPVHIRDGEFYMFVHSATYKIFCIVMTKNGKSERWSIKKIGNRPIIFHDMSRDKKPQIHFPGGAVYDAKKRVFYVCMGLGDVQLGYIVLHKDWVDAHLVDVKEITSAVQNS